MKEFVMPKQFTLNWYGMLTIKNIEQVTDLLRQLLENKRYTFVIAYDASGCKPEVRTSQRLMPGSTTSGNAISIHIDENGRYADFNVHDTYGLWGAMTHLIEDEYDKDFNNPYIVFEWNKVTITHRAPSGQKLYWIAAVEDDQD